MSYISLVFIQPLFMMSNIKAYDIINNGLFFKGRLYLDKYLERNRMEPIGIMMILITFFVLGTSI